MNDNSKIRLAKILASETDNKCMTTNYTAVAIIMANEIIRTKELVLGEQEVKILHTSDKYCDILGEIAIIDRSKFKSIILNVLRNKLIIKRDTNLNTLSSMLGLENGELDLNKDLSHLVSYAKNCFLKGA